MHVCYQIAPLSVHAKSSSNISLLQFVVQFCVLQRLVIKFHNVKYMYPIDIDTTSHNFTIHGGVVNKTFGT